MKDMFLFGLYDLLNVESSILSKKKLQLLILTLNTEWLQA